MRCALTCLSIVVMCGLLLCSPSTWADRTETDRSTHEFWAQFAQGDETIDVYAHMGRLVLATTDEERRSTILEWDSSSNQFTLFLRNEEITDLTTGEDNKGRPIFAGQYVNGVPSVAGFVDVTPDDTLIVELVTGVCATAAEQSDIVSLRYETEDNGVVVLTPGSCDCPVNGYICCKSDCDQTPPKICEMGDNATVRCKWNP